MEWQRDVEAILMNTTHGKRIRFSTHVTVVFFEGGPKDGEYIDFRNPRMPEQDPLLILPRIPDEKFFDYPILYRSTSKPQPWPGSDKPPSKLNIEEGNGMAHKYTIQFTRKRPGPRLLSGQLYGAAYVYQGYVSHTAQGGE